MSCATCSASTLTGSSLSLITCGVRCCPGDDVGDDVEATELAEPRGLPLYK